MTDEDRSLIQAQIENVKQENAVAKFKTLSETDASKVVQAVTNQATLTLVEQDEQVAKKVEDTAKKIIDSHITEQNNKAQFDVNKNACEIYGVEKSVPAWQQNMMKIGAGFWFVIYFIVASITIAPISTFTFKLVNVFKKTWIAIAVAVIAYLVIVFGIPFLATHL